MIQKSYPGWLTIVLHSAFWILFMLFPIFFHPDLLSGKNSLGFFFLFYAVRYIAWIALFYFNAYILMPGLIYQKKYTRYFIIQLLIISGLFLLHFTIDYFSSKSYHAHRTPAGFTILPYILIWACSTAFQMFRNKLEADKLSNEKEKENLKTELSFLRSQVSPHFMFNVLNNMVSLARKNSEQLEPSLIKFSSLLRYMVYETGEEKKELGKEIDYLQSFIDLQRQRFGANVKINVSLQRTDNNHTIEPMLLIPFVENAFKHGVVWEDDASIDIILTVKNGILDFFVKNKYDTAGAEPKDNYRGIGLQNVKRRLHLLYNDQHDLTISENNGWFTVSLQLNLDND